MPIEVGVCLYGPFTFERDCRPISPIVWLCLQGNTDLKKPMTVTIPHVLSDISVEELSYFEVGFMKADHRDISATGEYHF